MHLMIENRAPTQSKPFLEAINQHSLTIILDYLSDEEV